MTSEIILLLVFNPAGGPGGRVGGRGPPDTRGGGAGGGAQAADCGAVRFRAMFDKVLSDFLTGCAVVCIECTTVFPYEEYTYTGALGKHSSHK